MTAPDLPAAARTLLRQLDDWSHRVTHATGPCGFTGLSETEDGNGRRRRIEVIEQVDSVLVRACHLDGRAFVALWIRRPTRKGWALDLAWRGRGPDEHTPRPITATQLRAYVAAADLRAALAAVTPVEDEREAA